MLILILVHIVWPRGPTEDHQQCVHNIQHLHNILIWTHFSSTWSMHDLYLRSYTLNHIPPWSFFKIWDLSGKFDGGIMKHVCVSGRSSKTYAISRGKYCRAWKSKIIYLSHWKYVTVLSLDLWIFSDVWCISSNERAKSGQTKGKFNAQPDRLLGLSSPYFGQY